MSSSKKLELSFAQFFRALLIQICLSPLSSRWEAIQVHVGQLRLALRSFGRADAPFPEAHGRQTLPVRCLLALLFPIWPPRPAHEKTPELAAFAHTLKTHKHCPDTHKALTLSPTTTLLQAAWCRATFHCHHSSSWCCYHVLDQYDSLSNVLLLKRSGTLWRFGSRKIMARVKFLVP